MVRQDHKVADRPGASRARSDRAGNGDGEPNRERWADGERGNEYGGEGRFRTGGGYGSHFGGEPEAAAGQGENRNAWRDEQRRKFVEKFDRWRSERAAHAALSGPESASTEPAVGRSARK